jgi:ketosteroid isomerase-like protein
MNDYARALRSLPADSVAARFAPDGQLLLPGMAAVAGRAAIRDFLAPMNASFDVDSTTMESERVEGVEHFASQWGTYRQVAGPKGGPHDLHVGRFSALWTYDAKEGRWLIARLMMQPTPPPAGAQAAPAPSSAAPKPGR